MTQETAVGRHILVLNRFDREMGCRYPDYIDHTADRVAYLTSAAGRTGVDASLAETTAVVDDLADWPSVSGLARDIASRFGPLDYIVALFERDLEVAAALRELLVVPGPSRADVMKVRDKVTMKRLVAAAGLRVPRFAEASSSEQVRRFADEVGLPVVLKPRDGSGSQAIYLINSRDSLASLEDASPMSDYMCEEFITGTIYQVDGVVQDGTVLVLRAFRLLNSCLDYALGDSFGSVASDDIALEERLIGYSELALAALGVRSSVFHLEVFAVDPVGPGKYDGLVFLEVAARPGGAELPHIWREVYGLDLLEVAVRLSVGESPIPGQVALADEAGGYLLMPEPQVKPSRVLSVTSLIDRVPAMYAEILPEPGTILNGTGGAKETCGRYRFRAGSGQEIELAIRQVLANYEITSEPAAEDGGTAVVRVAGRAQSMTLP